MIKAVHVVDQTYWNRCRDEANDDNSTGEDDPEEDSEDKEDGNKYDNDDDGIQKFTIYPLHAYYKFKLEHI
jgi:hypothetical protein